jgi:hypothetical protein
MENVANSMEQSCSRKINSLSAGPKFCLPVMESESSLPCSEEPAQTFSQNRCVKCEIYLFSRR